MALQIRHFSNNLKNYLQNPGRSENPSSMHKGVTTHKTFIQSLFRRKYKNKECSHTNVAQIKYTYKDMITNAPNISLRMHKSWSKYNSSVGNAFTLLSSNLRFYWSQNWEHFVVSEWSFEGKVDVHRVSHLVNFSNLTWNLLGPGIFFFFNLLLFWGQMLWDVVLHRNKTENLKHSCPD